MKNSRVVAIAAAALVAGLVLGTMSLATAAPAASTTATAGVGARLGGFMRASGATLADVVAKLTGLKVEDVRASRQDGKSFADIAESKGVASDKVVSAALDARKAALDAAVKDGRVTQAQADAMLANMKSRIDDRIDSTAPGCNGAGGGMGGGMGGRGRGAGGCGGGGCLTAPAQ